VKTNPSAEPPLEMVPFAESGNAFIDIPVLEAPAREAAKPWRAEIYRDYSALEMAWRQLEETGHSTVFQRYNYATAIYDAAAATGAAEPLIVAVSKEGGGIAWLLPLCIRRQGKAKVISFADLGLADYTAPLMAPDAPLDHDSVIAIFKSVFTALPSCDLISFEKLAEDVQGVKNPLLLLQGLEPFHEKCHGIRLSEPWPDLAPKIMQRTLYKTIKRQRRNLEKVGKIKIASNDSHETLVPAMEQLLAMRRARFKAMGLTMPAVWEEFYRILVTREDKNVRASLKMLTVDDQPIAGCFGITCDKTYYALLSTFQMEKWESFRPGLQLFDVMLTEFSQQAGNGGYFDFTTGDEIYKGRLGADTRTLYDWRGVRGLKGLPYYMAWCIKVHCRRYPHLFAILKKMRRA
jgi:CelD/BcsL family acetyltransferase involved in cellulose biosynthesis